MKKSAGKSLIAVLLCVLMTSGVGCLWTKTEFSNASDTTITVFDQYSDDVTAEKVHVLLPFWKESVPVTHSGEVNTSELGEQTITYTAGDQQITRKITVIDDKAPEIELTTTADSYTLPGHEYEEEGYKAVDNYDGDITEKVTRSIEGDTVTYKVSDSSGNEANAERKIVFTMKKAPVLTVKNQTVTVGTEFKDSYSAKDEAGNDITDKVKVTGTVDTSKEGTYTLNYEVEDDYGNKSTASATITVSKKSSSGSDPEPDTKNVTAYIPFDNVADYSKTITNKAKINNEMLKILIAFENNYFDAVKNLSIKNKPSVLFCDAWRGYMWDSALNNLVVTRKANKYDLRLTEVSFDLKINSISYDKKTKVYKIKTLETSRFAFKYLPSNKVTQKDVENEFFIKIVDGKYMLSQQWKEESFYVYLYKKCESSKNYKSVIDNLNSKYIKAIADKNDKYFASIEKANKGKISFSKTADVLYNRKKAADYAHEYATKRNSQFVKCYSNCMCFSSQCIYMGGIPMDYKGSAAQQWKCYGNSRNSKEEKSGYSYSWTSISNFLKYLSSNTSKPTLVYEKGTEIGLAEPGDLVVVGHGGDKYSHAIIITDVVKDSNGNIIDFLYCGNTNDQYKYPLSATGYVQHTLIKIVGYNN